MIFTKRTYRAALQRALNIEYYAFRDHTQAMRGPEAWIKALRFTNALRNRRLRELGK